MRKSLTIIVTNRIPLVIKSVTVHTKTLEPRLFVNRREVICSSDSRGWIRVHVVRDRTQLTDMELDSEWSIG